MNEATVPFLCEPSKIAKSLLLFGESVLFVLVHARSPHGADADNDEAHGESADGALLERQLLPHRVVVVLVIVVVVCLVECKEKVKVGQAQYEDFPPSDVQASGRKTIATNQLHRLPPCLRF